MCKKFFFSGWLLFHVFLPSSIFASLIIYNDKDRFLTETGAISATGELPNLGLIPGGADASQKIGTATFTISYPSWELYIGVKNAQYRGAPPEDWTTLIPGNDIGISDIENLNVAFETPVYACGFDIAKEHQETSKFVVRILNDFTEVGSFTFTPPAYQAAFYGVWSSSPFTRIEIREVEGGIANEYFGQFYTGTIPLGSTAPVPLPHSLPLFATGLLGLAAYPSIRNLVKKRQRNP